MQDRQYFIDETLRCVDCGCSFRWTAGEQAYYASKGLRPPKRCQACRTLRRQTINPGSGGER